MSIENASLQLPRDLIEGAVKSHVSAAVVAALADHKKLLDVIVTKTLSAKVQSDGTPGRGYAGEKEFIEWLMDSLLRNTVTKVMNEEMEKFRPEIQKCLSQHLNKKKSALCKQLADSMVNKLVESSKQGYAFKVEVTPSPTD
jgi:NH3-dependent NAD+ synthetase